MSIAENLGHVIRDARENSGLSQRQLMEKMGFGKDARTWISKIENAAIVPTIGPLEKLAAALGTRVSILIAVAENYKPHARVKPSIVVGLVRNPEADMIAPRCNGEAQRDWQGPRDATEGDAVKARIYVGDAMERLRELLEESVDSVVTDPPYHLTTGKQGGSGQASENLNSPAGRSRATTGFMGKGWDGGDIAFRPDTWVAVMRVLKPGGYLVAFGGTRTYHRLACAIEDAGFEIRDQIGWCFGSGFPKSHNLHGDWEGWGTALKPAWEPICVARKPFKGTVEKNVLQHGTGAINIAGCRIEGEPVPLNRTEQWTGFGQEKRPDYEQVMNVAGRWPANLIHDGSYEVLAAFPNATGQCADVKYDEREKKIQNVYGAMRRGHEPSADKIYSDNGGTNFAMKPGARRLDEGSAARFFYCAKASKEDRNEGCYGLDDKPSGMVSNTSGQHVTRRDGGAPGPAKNNHPTVKPTDLMRWLCRLVTPPGGTVLDLFMGSGSTGKAALLEGFDFIGIERELEYIRIAESRIRHSNPLLNEVEVFA